MPPTDIGTFAGIFIGLYVAHGVADHWLQTDHQAATKGQPGWPGRTACARHVAVYTLTTSVAVLFLVGTFQLHVSLWGVLAGQAISAASHYWADRRFTLERLCDVLGKGGFYRLGKPRELEAQEYVLNSGHRVVRLFEPKSDSSPPISWDNPSLGTGAYALDQWWHLFWLFVAALVTVML